MPATNTVSFVTVHGDSVTLRLTNADLDRALTQRAITVLSPTGAIELLVPFESIASTIDIRQAAAT